MNNLTPVSNLNHNMTPFSNQIVQEVKNIFEQEYIAENNLIDNDSSMSTQEKITFKKNSLFFYLVGLGGLCYVTHKLAPYLS